jgi:hypothetical protein
MARFGRRPKTSCLIPHLPQSVGFGPVFVRPARPCYVRPQKLTATRRNDRSCATWPAETRAGGPIRRFRARPPIAGSSFDRVRIPLSRGKFSQAVLIWKMNKMRVNAWRFTVGGLRPRCEITARGKSSSTISHNSSSANGLAPPNIPECQYERKRYQVNPSATSTHPGFVKALVAFRQGALSPRSGL